jgi:hypothetical protein
MTKPYNTLPIYHFFGYQGGTIHQLASQTGCNSEDLIYLEGDYTHQSYKQGYKWREYASSTRNTLAILYKGDVQFWLGVRDTPEEVVI